MINKLLHLLLFSLALALPSHAEAQGPQRVTINNFIRAETDFYFATYVAQGAFGRFFHLRDVTPLDKQDIVRMTAIPSIPLPSLILMRGLLPSNCPIRAAASCHCC